MRARSTIFTGSHMSSANTSPPLAMALRLDHEFSCLRNGDEVRTASGCVTVSGPPVSIWRRNSGTTEPELSSTLPKRTIEKVVREVSRASPVERAPPRACLRP